jgi:cyclase
VIARPLRLLACAAACGAAFAAGAPLSAQQPDVQSRNVQGNVWLITAGGVNVAAQIGSDGVLVVDTGTPAVAEKILGEIRRLAGDKAIRFILNTNADADNTGGNAVIAKAGRSVIAGNFVGQAGAGAANAAKIIAHENVLRRLSEPQGTQPAAPSAAWPTDTFFVRRNDLYFNGEPIQMLHQPNAHGDADVIVYFRKSDVVVAGDVYINTTLPVINVEQGGTLNGVIAAVNRIIEITVPKDKQEAGTYVIPGHGRIADEADVVEYRDMLTIVRDRIQDAIKKGMTLQQVKAARLARDYEGRYGATQGAWTTDAFIEAAYRTLTPPPARQSTK